MSDYPEVVQPLMRFLDSKRGAGDLESTGSFTVSSRKASLQCFSLPSLEHAVLKWIQASLGWGARRIELQLLRERTSCFGQGACLPETHHLLQLVESPPQDDSPSADLALGLLGARTPAGSIYCSQRKGLDLEGIRLQGGEASELSHWQAGERQYGLEVILKRSDPRGFLTRLRDRLRATGDQHLLISNACHFSPVPIYFDGRLLSQGLEGVAQRHVVDRTGEASMVSPGWPQARPNLLALPGQRYRSVDVLKTCQYWEMTDADGRLETPEEKPFPSLAQIILMDRPGPLQLGVVKRGVVIEWLTEGPEYEFQPMAAVPADGLNTDLSTLRVVRDATLNDRFTWLRPHLGDLEAALRKRL